MILALLGRPFLTLATSHRVAIVELFLPHLPCKKVYEKYWQKYKWHRGVAGGAGDAGYGAAEPAYGSGGPAPAYDSYSQPAYNSYQPQQPQYSNSYGKYRKKY